MQKQKIIAIVGPTASGKTGLSLSLAQHFQGEVISADSRQVYRGLDIGTEKITQGEMGEVPHHLLDVAPLTEVFSAQEYKRLGEKALREILSREHVPIVVGGTGFYIRALLDGLVIPEVPPNDALRTKLEGLSAEELYEILKEKDPDRAVTIEAQNPRRLVRALEIVEALGKVPPLHMSETPYDVLYIGLETSDEVLKARIGGRLDTQLKRGLLHEVENLMQSVSPERLKEFGYEYRLAAEFLEGTLSLEEFRELLVIELWHYAKRQRTWFKRDPRIHWFKLEQQKEIEEMVERFLKK